MPEAFMFVGFVEGLIGTVIVGFALTYSMHKLVRCKSFGLDLEENIYVLDKSRI